MAKEMLTALVKRDQTNEYILYSFEPIGKGVIKLSTKFVNRVIRPVWGWNHLALPVAVWRDKIEVFLGLSQALPAFLRCRKIVIVHDAGFAVKPDFYTHSARLARVTAMAVKRADKVIAVSKTTKRDVQMVYGIKNKKIRVIYEGVNHQVFKPSEKRVKKYFLYVGGIGPNKNLEGLKKGFKKFSKKVPGYKLLMVGPEAGAKGYVAEKELVKLYQEATALVMPSHYEGFGLPVLEAQACGCLVIVGRSEAQKEISGGWGYIGATAGEIARAMEKIVDNKAVAINRQGGIRNAKKYSWERMAQEIHEEINQK
jgi:glycosyltransferase involved in cell wall biosynthesis